MPVPQTRPTYDETDPLAGVPPQPILRDAAPNAMPMRPSGPAAAASAMTGTVGIQATLQKMMQLEQLAMDIVKDLPGMAMPTEQFITMMRQEGMAALQNKTQGGPGVDPSSGAPTSGMPMAGPPAGAGAPMPPPPI